MRAKLLPLLGLGLLGSACDGSQPTQQNRPIVVRSQAQEELHRLDPMYRAITLRRAIYDSGGTCRRVTESGHVQEYGNLSMWTASCDSGRSYAVFIGPDGSAQ